MKTSKLRAPMKKVDALAADARSIQPLKFSIEDNNAEHGIAVALASARVLLEDAGCLLEQEVNRRSTSERR